MDLDETDLAGEGCCGSSPRFRHGLDAIGLPHEMSEIGIAYPGKAIVTPGRTPAVHDQEGAAIFAVVIADHALGMAAEAYHAAVFRRRYPYVLPHHVLHIGAADLHADDDGCTLGDVFFDGPEVYDVVAVAGREAVEATHAVLMRLRQLLLVGLFRAVLVVVGELV